MKNRIVKSKAAKPIEFTLKIRLKPGAHHAKFLQMAGEFGLTYGQLASALIAVNIDGDDDNDDMDIIGYFVLPAVRSLFPERAEDLQSLDDALHKVVHAYDELRDGRTRALRGLFAVAPKQMDVPQLQLAARSTQEESDKIVKGYLKKKGPKK